MDKSLLSGIISGGAGLIGSGINAWAQAKQNKLNREFQAEEAEKARQFNAEEAALNRQFQHDETQLERQWSLDMWNMTNEYNSPIEQLKRGQAAGLNPNAIIAGMNGVNSAGQLQSSAPSGSAANGPAASGINAPAPMVDLQGAANAGVQSFWNAKMNEAQIQNLNADSGLKTEQTNTERVNQDQINQAIENNKAEYDLILKKIEEAGLNNDYLKQTLESRVNRTKLENDQINQVIINLQQEYKKMEQEIEESKANQSLIEQKVEESKAQEDLLKKQGAKTDVETGILEQQFTVESIKAAIANATGITNFSDPELQVYLAAIMGKIDLQDYINFEGKLSWKTSVPTNIIGYGVRTDGLNTFDGLGIGAKRYEPGWYTWDEYQKRKSNNHKNP